MDVIKATAAYERWLRGETEVVDRDLRYKHACMDASLFAFFRATFYRWVPLWQATCGELTKAPALLGVGDLHIENFGSWSDSEGRLVWGVNDVDEATTMPYAVDLVRLATSALVARREDHLAIAPDDACAAILEGYVDGLEDGGGAFVLEEEHPGLRAWALAADRAPPKFWAKLVAFRTVRAPPAVQKMLAASLPDRRLTFRTVHRISGLGSLGRPRYVAIASWAGANVAREAKPMLRSAYGWALGRSDGRWRGADLLKTAIRCPDPGIRYVDRWQVRRLAPYCSRIELSSLPKTRDEHRLLHAMGRETANLHLGTRQAKAPVLRHLGRQKDSWLERAARAMLKATKADWKAWRARRRAVS